MHKSIRSTLAMGAASAMAVTMLMVPGTAMGKQGGGGGGGGGGGRPPSDESSNNLSVPALFVGAPNPYGLSCDGIAASPDGQVPSTGYFISPSSYYFVQGENTWQASCLDDQATATVNAAWGDNLTGPASKKVGKPIRVEIGLTTPDPVADLTGWEVLKLEDTLDRLSAYGTIANYDDASGTYLSSPQTPYPETRVWTNGATLKISSVDTGAVVYEGPAGAEVNATGKVVYGYNLRVTAAGDYRIDYTFPGVTLASAAPGTVSGQTASLIITVTAGGGGGGGRP